MKRTVLFCVPQMNGLAQAIAKINPRVQLGKINWHSFADGWPDLFIEDVSSCRDAQVVFLASLNSPKDIFEQWSVMRALPRYLVASLKIIVPYFPTGTMERVEQEGQVATAKTLASLLSNIPLGSSGAPAQIVIFDIHALAERFYFGDFVLPRLETAIPLLHKKLSAMKNVAIAFPDDGARKRFGKMFDGYHQIVCQKIRIGNNRKVTIKEGNPQGHNVVIVDDLVQTGGTLDECRKVLVKGWARTVSAYVTHAVFPGDSWKKFTDGSFDRFWVTDSCPEMTKKLKEANHFEVLSIAPLISELV